MAQLESGLGFPEGFVSDEPAGRSNGMLVTAIFCTSGLHTLIEGHASSRAERCLEIQDFLVADKLGLITRQQIVSVSRRNGCHGRLLGFRAADERDTAASDDFRF